MPETDQFNIRLSKSLLWDLDFIERYTGIQKNDWIRYKLAEAVRKEKESVMESLHRDYIRGYKSDADFRSLAGEPSDELKEQRKEYHKRMVNLSKDKRHRQFAQSAITEMLSKDPVIGKKRNR